jgi:hypothetical protein
MFGCLVDGGFIYLFGDWRSRSRIAIVCQLSHMCVLFLALCSNSESGTNEIVSFSFHILYIMFIIDYIFHNNAIVAHKH